jgi:hypothetical protein
MPQKSKQRLGKVGYAIREPPQLSAVYRQLALWRLPIGMIQITAARLALTLFPPMFKAQPATAKRYAAATARSSNQPATHASKHGQNRCSLRKTSLALVL